MSLRKSILQRGIRLLAGGANQKTTQGMIRGAGSTSRGGVETMGSMGTMPNKLGQLKNIKPAKGKVETMKSMGTIPKTPRNVTISPEGRMIIKASAPLATGIVGAKLSHDPSKNYRDTGPLAQLGKKMGMRGETFGSPPPSLETKNKKKKKK